MKNPGNRIRDFACLIKYKLSLAVTFSAGTGYFLFPEPALHNIIYLLPGIFCLSAGSAILNQYTERAQDSLMERTKERPIASKKISLRIARIILVALFLAGSILLIICGLLPFFLGVTTVVLYNYAYTRLKRITSLAIIPGALVGALPPLIGFTSAGGPVLSPVIIPFTIFMFMWQVPHFWLLLIRYGDEYHNAGFKTVSDFLSKKQIRHIVSVWILLTSVFLLIFFGNPQTESRILSYTLFVLNPVFILSFLRSLFSENQIAGSARAFIILNSFGFIVMFLLLAESLIA